jgi:hypothetical protein
MEQHGAESPDSTVLASGTTRGSARSGSVIDAKYERHRCYTVIGKKDEEIVRTAGELLAGSELLANWDLIVANLTSSFKRIGEWAESHRELLLAVYISLRQGEASLFFVSAGERYSIELDALMTEFEIQLGGSAGIGSVESFQIPNRSVDQFVGPRAVLLWQR